MSKIEVNTVDAQCGSTVTIGSSGKNVKIEGNDLRSNDYKASDGGNIINQSGTTITIGASGDTINLASGASQSGFGRTGTVNWDTTVKTAGFTGVSCNGYFINTTSGPITVNLPASPNAGDIMAVADYAGTAATNNITIGRNSSNITGIAENGLIQTNRDSITMVYIDGTQGWVPVNDNTGGLVDPAYVAATGGSVSTVCTDFKVHTFTGPGTFTVCQISSTAADNLISYMVVAGGGGSSQDRGGAGGAGGYRELKSPTTPYTASPLDGYPSAPNRITVTATGYPIAVGGGGPASPSGSPGGNGSNSSFSTITATAGGGGSKSPSTGNPGGSGGGGDSTSCGGAGNTPPTTPAQGSNGGSGSAMSPPVGNGGGGGAGGTGGNGTSGTGGAGGIGTGTGINPSSSVGDDGPSGSLRYFAGGGGGGHDGSSPGTGGYGGGGNGARGPYPGSSVAAEAGATNTGGGGGGSNGGGPSQPGVAGGSGIVILRYKYK